MGLHSKGRRCNVQIASLLEDEEGQAVIIPPDMEFDSEEVWIWRDEKTGAVLLSSQSDQDAP